MDPNCENARRSDPSSPTTHQPAASTYPTFDDFLSELPPSSLDGTDISDPEDDGLTSYQHDEPSPPMGSSLDDFPPDHSLQSIFEPAIPALPEVAHDDGISMSMDSHLDPGHHYPSHFGSPTPEVTHDDFNHPSNPVPASTRRGARKSRTPYTPHPTPQMTNTQLPKISSAGLVPVSPAPIVQSSSSVQVSQRPLTPQPTPNPPHAQLAETSNTNSVSVLNTPMGPPSVLKTATPVHLGAGTDSQLPILSPVFLTTTAPPEVIISSTPAMESAQSSSQMPNASHISPTATVALTALKTPTPVVNMRAPAGIHLPMTSPTPSLTPTSIIDMLAHTSLHIPLVSPTPSASSTISSQTSAKLSNQTAFQKSQALFQKNQAKKAREDQAASGPSGSFRSTAVPAPESKKRSYETSLEQDRDFMANQTQGDGEDNSWMEQMDEEEDEELTTLTEQFLVLNAKNKRGALSGSERIQLVKVESRLLQINRLRRGDQDEEEDDPNSMFIPESRDAVIARHRQKKAVVSEPEASDIEDSDDNIRPDVDQSDEIFASMLGQMLGGKGLDGVGSALEANPNKGLKANGEPRKRAARKINKTARDVHDNEQAKIAEKQREKDLKKLQKKKAETPASSKSKSKSKGKEKESAKQSTKSKKSGKKGKGKEKVVKNGPSLLHNSNWGGGEDEMAEGLLRSLAQVDPISDRMTNPIFNLGAEPELHGRFEKNTQIAKLFAMLPEGTSLSNAKNDRKTLLKASKAFGNGKVKAYGGKWHLAGMKETSALYHHQLLGAKWMLSREFSETSPHGGLLADAMGLGKTIQSLAVMIANSPRPEDIKRGVKATLIVAPASVVNQWVAEIAHHTELNTFPKVIKYKTSSNLSLNVLQDMDVVVTSYHEIMKQFPCPDAEAKKEIALIGQDAWWKKAMNKLGVLHQVNWYRVILDEAHAIKNNSARTSLACQNLKSVYRWCLTGTPLLNKLEELFPYLRFLKANFTVDYKTFQRYFCDGSSQDCHARIATLLSFTMIRRTMNTQIFGRAIITLPPPHAEVLKISFSPGEKILYRITESRFRASLNHFFAQGDAARHYSLFMVQLLRLRQCTSHPFMLEQTIRESWTLEDLNELKHRLARLSDRALAPFYKQVECWVGERNGTGDEENVVLPFGAGTYGHTFEFAQVLETLNEAQMAARTTCGVCSDLPVNGKKTPCHHVFCQDCITTAIHKDIATGDHPICPTCNKFFDINLLENVQAVDSSALDIDDNEFARGHKSKKRKILADSKGIDMLGFEPWTPSSWIPKSDEDDKFPLTPSSKTAALKAILLKGFHEAPMDKVVVYVQFRTLARIVARICQSENWGFLYLTGDTSLEHRAKVVARFSSDPDCKILISGLKCGGLGMNFQWANRAISLDLWWNHAVEQQAFGRIFRIGQNKETYFTRIAVKNSVDIRLLAMQIHKLKVCEKSIQEGNNNSALSLHQLANLFGFLRTDEDDNILSVEADYDDAEEWEEAGRRPGTAGSVGSD